MAEIRYFKTAERPDLKFWLEDSDGTLVNLTGYTVAFKVGDPGSAAVFTKTSGVTGAAGAGSEPDGTPNVAVTFTADELNSVPTNRRYRWQIKATTGGLDRYWQGDIRFLEVIT